MPTRSPVISSRRCSVTTSGPVLPGRIAVAGTIGQPPFATMARYFAMAAWVAATLALASVGVPSAGLRIQARVAGSPSSGGSSSP